MLGIDLGKNSCSLVGFDPAGTVVLRRRARRDTIVGLTAKLPACVVAMEACCGAHHLGRLLAAQGHTIRLMSPEYAKAKKNDDRDAEAIAEAATRPTMRFVPLKAPDQLDMQSLHRVRSRLVSMRTMLMNQLRAILLERGLVFPQGRRKFETAVGILVTDPQAQIGARIQALVAEIREEWASLDGRIEALDREFVAHARADEAARRLVSISGVGPMTATALRAAVDDGSAFASARDLPAWLGLVPRQHTTGGKPKLLGISKRGNAYLRGLFIHGARAALASLSKVEDATGRWLRSLLECTPVGPKIAV
ncbi:IS110-like element ISMex31 family transposase [Methylorubrum extorquens]|uniref:IS110-like element ISMex31 family transposase n=1 Tax=Methylorubrum extorquens TaxID=408 RepID=A0AAX3WKW0_METEX|nr:IS110-like element ISMex31 family transposase [Methylorubrum extorquens]AWI88000.1 IS110-like element ISMex31 family transposase [Methylobacterium sp. DM1]MCP1545850.1 transposase [Methylorubrum extorquens]MCP1591801.1 transposase [Methylorubrum extorquens]WHQ71058.1 IS110-like element ISMex31 family transposase [Methylorubrum extorquens]